MEKQDFTKALPEYNLINVVALSCIEKGETPSDTLHTDTMEWQAFTALSNPSDLTSCSCKDAEFIRGCNFPRVYITIVCGNPDDNKSNKEMFKLIKKDFFTAMRFWYTSNSQYTRALTIVTRPRAYDGSYDAAGRGKTKFVTSMDNVKIGIFTGTHLRIVHPKLHTIFFRFYVDSEELAKTQKLELEDCGFKVCKQIDRP